MAVRDGPGNRKVKDDRCASGVRVILRVVTRSKIHCVNACATTIQTCGHVPGKQKQNRIPFSVSHISACKPKPESTCFCSMGRGMWTMARMRVPTSCPRRAGKGENSGEQSEKKRKKVKSRVNCCER